jgi:hypothetical protein
LEKRRTHAQVNEPDFGRLAHHAMIARGHHLGTSTERVPFNGGDGDEGKPVQTAEGILHEGGDELAGLGLDEMFVVQTQICVQK